jgi:dTDP-4-dehydrorhamnose reductase
VVEATKKNLAMTWLITGSEGQLGKEMQLALYRSGIEFIALNSRELDISSEVAVEESIEKHRPKVILNAAAWTDVDGAEKNKERAFNINANGPKYLAKGAKKYGATLVQISTDYVFSGVGVVPWAEDCTPEPISVYGHSKSLGERYVFENHKERSYILRTAWLYSAQGKNFVKTMADLAINNNNEVKVVLDQIGQPTFAKDLTEQIIKMVCADLPFGIYHGTNSGEASWFDLAQNVFKLSGAKVSRVIPVDSSQFIRPAERPQYSVLGHEKWKGSGLSTMRNWKIALEEAMPAIINQIERVE